MKEQTKGKNSFPLNPFLFAFCFNKVFWNLIISYAGNLIWKKIKNVRCVLRYRYGLASLHSRSRWSLGSDNSVYLARSCRRSTHILLRYAPQNIRYTRTLDDISPFGLNIYNKDEEAPFYFNLIFLGKTI